MLLIGKYTRVIIHLLAWQLVAFIMIIQLRLILGVPLPIELTLKQVGLFILLIVYYYANEKFFVPRLLYKEKLPAFIALHLGIITCFQVLGRVVDFFFHTKEKMIKLLLDTQKLKLNIDSWTNLDATLLLTSFVVAGVSTCIALVQIWQNNLRASELIRKKQVDAELALLKAQIHPHFFFNTLNNIYSLSFDDIDNSRASLYKLSRMMRYLLYETPNNQTTLSREIEFVRDYIELMGLRMTETMRIELEVPEQLVEKPVAPMILLPFIENAFKHGVSSLMQGEIIVRITQQGNHLKLYVQNHIFKDKGVRIEDGGIGLTNTERRLEMLYPGRHQLRYGRNEQDSYIVELELEL